MKKNNFLPLLLVGGGVGAAVLLFTKATSKTREDTSMLSGGGIGGSGDFFGNSTPVSSIPVIDPMLHPDSVDAGIEDIARNDTNLGLTDPSSGGVNPTDYGTDGVDLFTDLAIYTGAGVAASAAVAGVKKAAGAVTKTAGTTAAGKVANTAASKATTSAAASTAGKVASTAAKGAGVLGALGLVDMFFDVTGLKDAHFSQGGLTGNLQGVNTSFSVNSGGITTDKATSQEVGYMAYDNKQLQTATGLQSTGSKWETISAEETRIVNEALGTTGDVIKQSYGSSGYSYIGAGGKQLTFAGTDLQTAAGLYKQHNAGKR